MEIFIDDGSEKIQKLLYLRMGSLTKQEKSAYTGDDYVANFLRKDKLSCWKRVSKNSEFFDIFRGLEIEIYVPEETFSAMETFICFFYGDKKPYTLTRQGHAAIF